MTRIRVLLSYRVTFKIEYFLSYITKISVVNFSKCNVRYHGRILKRCSKLFKERHEGFKNNPRSGQSHRAIISDTIAQVDELIKQRMKDKHRWTVRGRGGDQSWFSSNYNSLSYYIIHYNTIHCNIHSIILCTIHINQIYVERWLEEGSCIQFKVT